MSITLVRFFFLEFRLNVPRFVLCFWEHIYILRKTGSEVRDIVEEFLLDLDFFSLSVYTGEFNRVDKCKNRYQA